MLLFPTIYTNSTKQYLLGSVSYPQRSEKRTISEKCNSLVSGIVQTSGCGIRLKLLINEEGKASRLIKPLSRGILKNLKRFLNLLTFFFYRTNLLTREQEKKTVDFRE